MYCNARIVVIDFSVQTTRNYSFFINDELCDLEIEEKDGKFSYGFKVDQVTDTPRNRGRRKMIRCRSPAEPADRVFIYPDHSADWLAGISF